MQQNSNSKVIISIQRKKKWKRFVYINSFLIYDSSAIPLQLTANSCHLAESIPLKQNIFECSLHHLKHAEAGLAYSKVKTNYCSLPRYNNLMDVYAEMWHYT